MNLRAFVCVTTMVAVAACTDTSTPTTTRAATAADSADQIMFGVRFFVTDAGVRRAEVHADTAYMYEDNTRTEMRQVNATFFTQTGTQDGVLTSQQGTYNTRLGNMEARGNVVVTATDGRKLESPHLKYDPARNEITSDSSFVVTEKSGRKSSGIGFISDPDLRSIRVLRAAKISGTPVEIPRR
jgi:LPS export ABC transporter protein LptC